MKKIDITEWKEYRIGDLFSISKPLARVQTAYEEGEIPFVASGSENNGVQKYCTPINNEQLEDGNCITVSPVDGYAFFQTTSFLGRGGAGSSINILRNPQINKKNALFICTMIRRVCSKYSYSQMCSASSLANESISLPATSDGTPDWQYMEESLNKCNIHKWKEYKVGQLFDIFNGKGITKFEISNHTGTIPTIQSGEDNFGVIGHLDKDYCLQQNYTMSKGMCLTVARSGSSGFVGIQTQQCVVGDSAKILEPKFNASVEILLFIRALLMVNKKKYAYTDKVTKENYEADTIPLPTTSSGTPDWAYMEQFIRSIIASKSIATQHLLRTME